MKTCDSHPIILLTGATGYIGGRLLSQLEERNARLRCLVRQPERLAGQVSERTEIIAGVIKDFRVLHSAMQGVDAEMKLPGRAWLEFEIEPNGTGSTIRQTASFDPRGLFGILYWYTLFPLHAPIFRGMLHQIASLAEQQTAELDKTTQHPTGIQKMRRRSEKQRTRVRKLPSRYIPS